MLVKKGNMLEIRGIGIRYTERFLCQTVAEGDKPKYYTTLEVPCDSEIAHIARAFDWVTSREDRYHYGVVVLKIFDEEPTDEALLTEIQAGNIGISHQDRETPDNFKVVLDRFLAKKATFRELKMAAGKLE